MTPINPATPAAVDPRSPMAPPYVDEDPDLALVQQGLNEAENEIREEVADDYEANARLSDDPEGELDDIDFSTADDASGAPEVAAMHEEADPSDGEDTREDEEEDDED